MIGPFKGEFSFLSNFWGVEVEYDGDVYQNSESAFQAAKLKDKSLRRNFIYNGKEYDFTKLAPNTAKWLGKRVPLRKDWEEIKIQVMCDVVRAKFIQNQDLAKKLLDTGDEYLAEVNNWRDRFWGVCGGTGKNYLGIILMQVREAIRNYVEENNIEL